MALLFLVNIFVIINLHLLRSPLFGGVIFVLYLVINGYFVGRFAGKLFPIQESTTRLLFGALFVFLAVASLGGIFIIFFRYDDFIFSGIVLVVGLTVAALADRENTTIARHRLHRMGAALLAARASSLAVPIVITIFLLFGIGFYTLFSAGAEGEYIRSPWDVIPDQFILVIVLLTTFLLCRIAAKPNRFLLIPIIVFSLLQHLYIPATYRLPYGGDTWRHTAAIMEIEDTGFISPSSYDTFQIGPFTIPSSTFTTSSYASFWASGIFLNRMLHLDLVTIMVWWQYILFSIMLPVLFYILFNCIFDKNRAAPLLGAFLPSLFFPMQAYGAVSLPVGFGFLSFAIFLLAVILWMKTRKRTYLAALLVLLGVLAIHYVVYFLFGVLIAGFLIVRRASLLVRTGYLIASIAFIPVVSLFVSPNARLDILTTGADHIWDFWKHVFLYLFGLKGMDGYYLHTGNLVWHSMRDRLIELPPFSWEYLDTALFFFFVLVIGASVLWMCSKDRIAKFPAAALFLYILFVGLMSIFIDRLYLGGIHLLTERLDLIIDTAFIFFLVGGCMAAHVVYKKRRVFLAVSIVIAAIMIGSTYASGPIHGRVTGSHYRAMQALYEDMERQKRTDYCVLSEHFSLAALEVASRRRVKNGNFPIKYGYLEEGGKIFIKMFSRPDILWMKDAAAKSSARGCYFVVDKRFLVDWNKTQIRWVLGREVIEVDDVHIWRYDTSTL